MMASLAILPFLFLPLPLVLPQKHKQALPSFYESLRELPHLPSSPTPLDRLRYEVHKAYFQYLVTGPGYVLEPAERLLLDLFVMVLLGAIVWCSVWSSPYVVRVIGKSVLSVSVEEGAVAFGYVDAWDGNMSLSVRTVYMTTFGASNSVGNVTATMGV